MAHIVTITNPVTGQPAQVDQLDHTAQQIDDAVEAARWSHRNLLDNSYWSNPDAIIDQRGGYVVLNGSELYSDPELKNLAGTMIEPALAVVEKTNEYAKVTNDIGISYYAKVSDAVRGYVGAGYGIDRWKLNGVDGGNPVYLVDTHELINNSTSGYAQTVQIIPYDFAKNLVGKTVTMSVLFDEGLSGETFFELQEFNTWTRIAFQSVTAVSQVVSVTFTMPSISNNIQFYVGTRGNCKPIAAKLELGTVQTLAHQENGNWVLNDPPPDKGMELLKCQRYYQIFATQSLRPTDKDDFRPPMRVTPALGTININGKTYYTADANL